MRAVGCSYIPTLNMELENGNVISFIGMYRREREPNCRKKCGCTFLRVSPLAIEVQTDNYWRQKCRSVTKIPFPRHPSEMMHYKPGNAGTARPCESFFPLYRADARHKHLTCSSVINKAPALSGPDLLIFGDQKTQKVALSEIKRTIRAVNGLQEIPPRDLRPDAAVTVSHVALDSP